jgi:hypothetical protein
LTVKVWLVTARTGYDCGLVHAVKAALSSEQAYVAPVGLSDVKLNEALVAVVGDGGLAVMMVSGGVVSTVQVWVAVPVLPAGSVAVTVKVWLPAATVLL